MAHSETFLGWYVHRDGQPAGPLSTEEVARLAARGQLDHSEEILKGCRDRYGRVRFFGSQVFTALDAGRREKPPEGPAVVRVLIVDDCKDGADSLAILLRLWGHEAQVAYDGPSALRLAAAFEPDVFLLDIGLPGMDGCCLARQLRAQAAFRGALLVATSGFADPAHRALGKEAGFEDYLVKPLDLLALKELLARRGTQ